MFRVALVALLTASVMTGAAHARTANPDPPLGIPVPSQLRIDDLLSHSSEGGNGQSILPGAGACESAHHRPISLPADDAPHNNSHIEWWWWYGHLKANDGRRFAYIVWFASKPWGRIYWADYTLTDLSTGTFHYGREPLIPGRPKAAGGGFSLRGDHAGAVGRDGRDHLQLDVDGYELDLALKQRKPPVIELGDGYGNFYCNANYFYSRPRMATVGTMTQSGKRTRVTGTSNFLHQWGFMPAIDIATSTYLSFQLRDGRDIFLGLLSLRNDGDELSVHIGSISDARGRVTTLNRRDFRITPTGYWKRDDTCKYPVEYDVEVKGLRLHVAPQLEHTEIRADRWPEMFALWPAWPVYWDGPTTVTGDVRGRGWLDQGHGWCAT